MSKIICPCGKQGARKQYIGRAYRNQHTRVICVNTLAYKPVEQVFGISGHCVVNFSIRLNQKAIGRNILQDQEDGNY